MKAQLSGGLSIARLFLRRLYVAARLPHGEDRLTIQPQYL